MNELLTSLAAGLSVAAFVDMAITALSPGEILGRLTYWLANRLADEDERISMLIVWEEREEGWAGQMEAEYWSLAEKKGIRNSLLKLMLCNYCLTVWTSIVAGIALALCIGHWETFVLTVSSAILFQNMLN